MKKLLSTTAILSAFAFAGAANAADLQVNVGGFLDFQAGYVNDKIIHETGASANANEFNFNNDTEIHFSVDGKADNGLEYGAVVELKADISADNTAQAKNTGGNADKTYLFLQGGWGRVELGGNTDAAEALSVNSSTFASGTGGVDGDFYRYASIPGGNTAANAGQFLIRPDLPIANNINGNGTPNDEDATKISYYSPRFAGFQAGASYIPNTAATGTTSAQSDTVGFKDVVSGGVNYASKWDSVGFKAAVTGQTGKNKTAGLPDLKAWDAGANVSFAGFTAGGSYGDLDNSLGAGFDTKYWDAGLGYEFGAFSTSATYIQSQSGLNGDNDFRNLVVGIDYKLAPGLVPYAEVSYFDYAAPGSTTATDNKGTVVILGSELSF